MCRKGFPTCFHTLLKSTKVYKAGFEYVYTMKMNKSLVIQQNKMKRTPHQGSAYRQTVLINYLIVI